VQLSIRDVRLLLNLLRAYWHDHGTKILGTVSMVLSAAAATPGLFEARATAYVCFVNALVAAAVVRRGFTNSAKPPP
jgi:hypothetical protein